MRSSRGFTSACITESGLSRAPLLGLVTTRDVDLIRDRSTSLSEVMTATSDLVGDSQQRVSRKMKAF